mmetsp:Transcript_18619/g.19265  ORF Transcript_18619/g.19265 Transcript_18619/m.19265 type:complete len:403 (+) Transcript_18619:63-1271(+)
MTHSQNAFSTESKKYSLENQVVLSESQRSQIKSSSLSETLFKNQEGKELEHSEWHEGSHYAYPKNQLILDETTYKEEQGMNSWKEIKKISFIGLKREEGSSSRETYRKESEGDLKRLSSSAFSTSVESESSSQLDREESEMKVLSKEEFGRKILNRRESISSEVSVENGSCTKETFKKVCGSNQSKVSNSLKSENNKNCIEDKYNKNAGSLDNKRDDKEDDYCIGTRRLLLTINKILDKIMFIHSKKATGHKTIRNRNCSMAESNNSTRNHYSIFESEINSRYSLEDFINKLNRIFSRNNETSNLLALLTLDNFLKVNPLFILTSNNVFLLLLTCYCVSIKANSDEYIPSEIVPALSFLSGVEIFEIEMFFIQTIDYKTVIDMERFTSYREQLYSKVMKGQL